MVLSMRGEAALRRAGTAALKEWLAALEQARSHDELAVLMAAQCQVGLGA
jgi:hypothetical protein